MDTPPPQYDASQTEPPAASIRAESIVSPAPSTSPKPAEVVIELREVARTPSPTPSETEALQSRFINPRRLLTKKFWFSKQSLCTVYFHRATLTAISTDACVPL